MAHSIIEAKEMLLEARGLLERGWTQHAHIRDAAGNPVSTSMEGCSYCIIGALETVGIPERVYNLLRGNLPAAHSDPKVTQEFYSLAYYNDLSSTTQADILALIDSTINNLRG